MIKLNEELYLLKTNEEMSGSLGLSSDIIYQHTFSAWIQFLSTGKITRVNPGVLAVWEDEDFLIILEGDNEARRKIHSCIDLFAEKHGDYYLVTPKVYENLRPILNLIEQPFFTDQTRKTHTLKDPILLFEKPYYCGFVYNMFNVPVQFVRQKGQNYYFAQVYKEVLFVPNVHTLENSNGIITGWCQKLILTRQELWKRFCVQIKSQFGIKISYGKSSKGNQNTTVRQDKRNYRTRPNSRR